MEDSIFRPTRCTQAIAPPQILHMIKCGWKTTNYKGKCTCKGFNVKCTAFCGCLLENCLNRGDVVELDSDESDCDDDDI